LREATLVLLPVADSVRARGLLFVEPGVVEVRDVDLEEPEDGEVLVRTAFSGISGGTEMLAYRGELDPDMPRDETLGSLGGTFRYPFAYGYAAAGTVERSRGDVPEGEDVLAFHPHQDRFVVGTTDVVPVTGTELRLATLLPLVETALQITLDAEVRLGEPAVVLGLGPVGILTGALLARSGATVLGCDPRRWRREVAKRFGFEAYDPDGISAAVREQSPEGVPLVVEVSGQPAALSAALGLLGNEGTALVASWYGRKPVELPLGAEFHRRRLSIRSTQVSTIPARLSGTWSVARRRAVALELLRELPVQTLATQEYAFDDAQAAYDAISAGEEGLMHVALAYP
jgi:2-desacetyl-2-hydroxyethyl bacteriochlorophyllide A dehydrogenase